MKSLLEDAASLFRENEMSFGDVRQDKEKANLYRGLALLAEGLCRLEERFERLEAERTEASISASD
ncbi:hypothetical protein [Pedosphaera parvula]|uniref:Uncharacterized protein n=1 Tax=Pedosphaera parvula (strain Ellin514) TaxID=320771 RepID=B9XDX6_PEDPL|nr:hypothetical protein [Pedosphaera parvula]EEF61867.1 hypothetical protein Cflav_PD4530 [Pedosphaera parvula Ellin514]